MNCGIDNPATKTPDAAVSVLAETYSSVLVMGFWTR